jgi:hypothetical protein
MDKTSKASVQAGHYSQMHKGFLISCETASKVVHERLFSKGLLFHNCSVSLWFLLNRFVDSNLQTNFYFCKPS